MNGFEVFSENNLTRDHREEAVLTKERIALAFQKSVAPRR